MNKVMLNHKNFDHLAILIVDPVDNIRVTLASMVSDLGAGLTLQAKNGAEAKLLIEKGRY
jgi:hypothetical protein